MFYKPKARLNIGYFFVVTTVIQCLTFQNADNTTVVTHVVMYLLHLHTLAPFTASYQDLRVCITL